jgi:glutathione S-transferase
VSGYLRGMLTLFNYPASRNGWKVRQLLQQLGRPHQTVTVDIFQDGTQRAEYRRDLNPTGKVPAIQLDDGRALAESNAILVYLAEGSMYLPSDSFDRAKVLQWMSFEQEQVESTIGTMRYWRHANLLARRPAELVEEKRSAARKALGILDRVLAKQNFLIGNRYSIADISMFAYSTCAADAEVPLDPFPNFLSWVARIESLPGFLAPPR